MENQNESTPANDRKRKWSKPENDSGPNKSFESSMAQVNAKEGGSPFRGGGRPPFSRGNFSRGGRGGNSNFRGGFRGGNSRGFDRGGSSRGFDRRGRGFDRGGRGSDRGGRGFDRGGRGFSRGNRGGGRPFNRGGGRDFSWGNGRFSDQQNEGGEQNFNSRSNFRGQRGFNNRGNFNRGFNKSWEDNDQSKSMKIQDEGADNADNLVNQTRDVQKPIFEKVQFVKAKDDDDDFDSSDVSEEEIKSQPDQSVMQTEEASSASNDECESSDGEAEAEFKTPEIGAGQGEDDSSESEEEVETKINETVKQNKPSITAKSIEKKAGKLDEFDLKNAELVKERNSRSIHVSNLHPAIKESHLMQFFSKYGKIKEVSTDTSKTTPGKHSRYSTIQFEKPEDAVKAIEVNGMEYKGHHFAVQLRGDNKTEFESSTSIYVGNLLPEIDRDLLWAAFEPCGLITKLRIRSAAQRSSSCAFISFASPDSVELALEMNKATFETRRIFVERCYNLVERKAKRGLAVGRQQKPRGAKVRSGFVQKRKFAK